MALPALANPADVPLHVLFPEHYEASKKEITRDFVFFGSVITMSVVLVALIGQTVGV